jgi:hypothetical protein
MPKRRKWPTIDEMVEKAKKGILDDTEDAVPPYKLEDWEIHGGEAEAVEATGRVAGPAATSLGKTRPAHPAPVRRLVRRLMWRHAISASDVSRRSPLPRSGRAQVGSHQAPSFGSCVHDDRAPAPEVRSRGRAC